MCPQQFTSATNRQQQNALTAAIRHKPANSGRRREQDRSPRSRSPLRGDRDSGHLSRRPFKRGSSRRGGTSRSGRGGKGRTGSHCSPWWATDFISVPPLLGSDRALTGLTRSPQEHTAMEEEVGSLLRKGAIEQVYGDFSPISS